MKKIILLLFVLISLLTYSQGNSGKTGFLRANGTQIVNSQNENVLLRGIGLGGHMLQEGYMLKVPFSGQQHVIKEHIEELIGEEKTAEFYKAWLNNHTQKADVDSLKSWGFNSIRLPMHYNLYTLSVDKEPVKGENTWLEKGFRMTDSLLSWCKANEMYLILDMHAAPGGQGHDVNISDRDPSKPSLWESKENQDKLVALWVKLAERYKGEPAIGAYDLINEPNWSFEEGKNKNGTEDTINKPIRELQIRLTKAIREVDQNHIVIIEGNGWGNNYKGILPPWDDNLVLSFHKYWSFNEQNVIQQFLEIREKYNIPIWLGESGENSNAWFADAIQLAERNNIGWCWWPLKKLGSNNPVEIKVNKGYLGILNYWEGKGDKPSETEAYEAFMQLAENTKIENCVIHKDVIDAMMRQPHSTETIPFKNVMIPADSILAVDYDLGNNGSAYNDLVSGNYYVSTGGDRQRWNNGYAYRNDGVDIFEDEEKFFVGDTEAGEWLRYTFTAEKTGNYDISFEVASEAAGKVQININLNIEEELDIPNTSGEWKWVNLKNVPIKKGENQLKFIIKEGEFNFRTIRFEPVK